MAELDRPPGVSDSVATLRSLPCIRRRCQGILEAAREDRLKHFRVNEAKMDDVVAYVRQLMDKDYDSYDDVPYHSRWRHFEVGEVDRTAALKQRWGDSCDAVERARRLVDLVVTSVLLDAGAGDVWRFHEAETGFEAGRSEGLGVASFHMFVSGAFSSDTKKHPHQADSRGLRGLGDDCVQRAFQVDDTNPLVGCGGRTQASRAAAACSRCGGKRVQNLPASVQLKLRVFPAHLCLSKWCEARSASITPLSTPHLSHCYFKAVKYQLAMLPRGRVCFTLRSRGYIPSFSAHYLRYW